MAVKRIKTKRIRFRMFGTDEQDIPKAGDYAMSPKGKLAYSIRGVVEGLPGPDHRVFTLIVEPATRGRATASHRRLHFFVWDKHARRQHGEPAA